MSTTGWAAIILAIIIVLGGAWWYMSDQAPAQSDDINIGANAAGTIPEGTAAPDNGMVGGDADPGTATQTAGVTVHYTSSGFTPKSISIKAGEKVTFVNDTSGAMWVASDEHPTHTEFDGTDRTTHCSGAYTGPTPFDQCQPGSSYTFVFAKTGTFEYHNHSAAQFTGTVVVQ